GLLHERDAEPGMAGGCGGADEVRRLDSAARPVAEHERTRRRAHFAEMDARKPVGSLELPQPRCPFSGISPWRTQVRADIRICWERPIPHLEVSLRCGSCSRSSSLPLRWPFLP